MERLKSHVRGTRANERIRGARLLRVEHLESRCLLSFPPFEVSYHWDHGGAGNDMWSNRDNWDFPAQGGGKAYKAPGKGDSAVFDSDWDDSVSLDTRDGPNVLTVAKNAENTVTLSEKNPAGFQVGNQIAVRDGTLEVLPIRNDFVVGVPYFYVNGDILSGATATIGETSDPARSITLAIARTATIGTSGKGTLTLNNSTSLTALSVNVGSAPLKTDAPKGIGLIDLKAGSKLTCDALSIGAQQAGELSVSAAGSATAPMAEVSCKDLTAGSGERGDGNISSAGKITASQSLNASTGPSSSSVIILGSGGSFTVQGPTKLASGDNSTAELLLHGTSIATAAVSAGTGSRSSAFLVLTNSSWTATQGIQLGTTASKGEMTELHLDTSEVHSSDVVLNEDAVLDGSGTISAPITNSGRISPGDQWDLLKKGNDSEIGRLNINGDLNLLSKSVIKVDISGTEAMDYDTVGVTGLISLAGDVTVHFLNYTPKEGDFFDIVTSTSAKPNPITGKFNTKVLGSKLPAGLKWAWDYRTNPNVVRLRVVKDIAMPVSATEGQPFTNTEVSVLQGIGASLLPYLTAGINYDYHPGDSYTYVTSAPGPNGRIVMDGDDAIVEGSNTYASEGEDNVRVVFYCDGQEIATVDSTASVDDAALTLTPPIDPITVTEGQPISYAKLATFADAANSGGTHDEEYYLVTVAWGDGAVTNMPLTGDGVWADSRYFTHSYAEAGAKDVTITVSDPDGATATAQATINVTDAAVWGWGNNGPTPADGNFSGLVATFLDPGDLDGSAYTATVELTRDGTYCLIGTQCLALCA